jgi:hypothetical protein
VRDRYARALTLLLAATALAAAQDKDKPEGAITGEVRDAASGFPIAGAALTADAGGSRATAASSPHGVFRFDHLAPNTYQLRCSLAGYVDASEEVEVKAGETTDRVVFSLMPLATLEGVVLDEEGRPVAGVNVYTGANLRGATDRDGRFRMENLSPGPYRISVRLPFEMRRRTLRRNSRSGETTGYPAAEFYPGTADPQAATAIDISGGVNLRGFEIRLRRVPLVSLSGRLLDDATGKPLTGAAVELVQPANRPSDPAFDRRSVDFDAGFRFELIPPGAYSLLVFRDRSAMPHAVPLEVGRTGAEKLTVSVPPLVRISGVVRTAPDPVEWSGPVILSLSPMQRGTSARTLAVTTPEFTVDDLPPGDYRIQVESRAARSSDSRVLVAGAVRLGSVDLRDGLAMITESGTPPLEIVLSGETGRILGTATGLDGEPLRHATVLVHRAEMTGGRVARRGAFVGDDGRFTVEDLAPGAYQVTLAVEAGPDPVRPPTERVEVRAGETTAVHLRVAK